MKSDSRILEGKKPLTCFDVENAKQFIGKKGYFSHYIDNYADLKNTVLGTLTSTGDTFHESFVCTEEPFDNYYYEFFIPAEYVKPEEPEKKWRAYTIAEFQEAFTVGKAVRFRRKDEPTKEHLLAFGGYYTLHDGRVSILFGIHLYTLEELFEKYEWQEFYTDEYRPFGIEE